MACPFTAMVFGRWEESRDSGVNPRGRGEDMQRKSSKLSSDSNWEFWRSEETTLYHYAFHNMIQLSFIHTQYICVCVHILLSSPTYWKKNVSISILWVGGGGGGGGLCVMDVTRLWGLN